MMLEESLRDAVVDLAHLLHLRVAYFRAAQSAKGWRTPVGADGKGWPDLIITGRRLLVRELKQDRKYPDADQRAWIAALKAAGVDVAVWREADLHSGLIRRELEAIR